MTKYRPTWELSTIPDALLQAEAARRNGRKGGGRPAIKEPCTNCGQLLSATERRKPCPHCGARQPRK